MARIELHSRGLWLEAESHGDPANPAILLAMGLGMQLVSWPRSFVDALVAGGMRVVVFDNRDAGLSGSGALRAHASPPRAALAHLLGMPFVAPYTIADLADDTLALADALGIERFHVAGVSLGGMVAQRVAIAAPQRVLSLASIMSHAGSATAPWPRAVLLAQFVKRPPKDAGEDAKLAHFVALFRALGHIGEGAELDALRERLRLSIRRAYRPDGSLRQLLAVTADRDRRSELARLRCPALILHGDADPLVPVGAAAPLRGALPHARVRIVPRLGHYLPEWFVPILTEEVIANARR